MKVHHIHNHIGAISYIFVVIVNHNLGTTESTFSKKTNFYLLHVSHREYINILLWSQGSKEYFKQELNASAMYFLKIKGGTTESTQLLRSLHRMKLICSKNEALDLLYHIIYEKGRSDYCTHINFMSLLSLVFQFWGYYGVYIFRPPFCTFQGLKN